MMIAKTHLAVIKNIINFSEVIDIKPLQGGDINSVYHIRRKQTDFVIKINNRSRFPEMFVNETEGLNELRKSKSFIIPEVINCGVYNEFQYLLLEYIQPSDFQNHKQLGENLVALHQFTSDYSGFINDNYIGTLPQVNKKIKDGIQFIIENRWDYQLKMFSQENYDIIAPKLDVLIQNIRDIIPVFSSCLLHGDLWSGNIFYSKNGYVLIDPAVYYGNPITDLAMMKLFGGFSNTIFERYNDYTHLDYDWEKLVPLFQIYPLMVHVNLFGSSYLRDLNSAIEKYI